MLRCHKIKLTQCNVTPQGSRVRISASQGQGAEGIPVSNKNDIKWHGQLAACVRGHSVKYPGTVDARSSRATDRRSRRQDEAPGRHGSAARSASRVVPT